MGGWSKAVTVGVYDDTTISKTLVPGSFESYNPAAWMGRKASAPVGHQQMRGSSHAAFSGSYDEIEQCVIHRE